MKQYNSRARGFTLIEALVALIVLSIGLLGIASLQLSSLRWNHGASMRSQATLLAYDILDRMRVNATSAKNGEYLTGATPGTVATNDLSDWRTNITSTLGAGSMGAVTRVGTTDAFTITITWNDPRSGDADPTVFTMSTQL
jgi:type IV pilus assembly protein PilV